MIIRTGGVIFNHFSKGIALGLRPVALPVPRAELLTTPLDRVTEIIAADIRRAAVLRGFHDPPVRIFLPGWVPICARRAGL